MSKPLVSPKATPPETELIELQSLYESAFALCLGLKLHSMDRREGSKVTFVFKGKDAARKMDGFFNGAKVEARAYSDAVRSLKDRIFKR